MQYHKIQNVYRRSQDDRSRVLRGVYMKPEFELLAGIQWEATEKIHGMNMRAVLEDGTLRFAGKSDRAQIPGDLMEEMERLFDQDAMREVFEGAARVTVYGEGYGAGINKGGLYQSEKKFRAFDILVDGTWLNQVEVCNDCYRLGVETSPTVVSGTLSEIVEYVAGQPLSVLANDTYVAKGVVARPHGSELRNSRGERIICKIKARDLRPEGVA